MKPPITTCQECNGTGKAQLSEPLTETLSYLGRRHLHAAQLQIPGVTPNAINNRLEKLRELGFVQRVRQGRFMIYSRVPSAKSDSVPARHS